MAASDGWLDVAQAARLLDVAPSRVRQLIDAGELRADRWAGRWRIDRGEVQRFSGQGRRGRPYSPAVAWVALSLLDSGLRAPGVGRQQRARARVYASQIAAGHVDGLRRRAAVVRGRVHPGLIASLAREIVVSGAAAMDPSDPNRLADDSGLEGYVSASRWQRLEHDFDIRADDRPNVVLRIVEDEFWPFAAPVGRAGPVVVAVDLLEQGDERATRAARAILRRAESAVS